MLVLQTLAQEVCSSFQTRECCTKEAAPFRHDARRRLGKVDLVDDDELKMQRLSKYPYAEYDCSFLMPWCSFRVSHPIEFSEMTLSSFSQVWVPCAFFLHFLKFYTLYNICSSAQPHHKFIPNACGWIQSV